MRAGSDEEALRRLYDTFDSGDPELMRHFTELAADHLLVVAGDKDQANLGLDQQTWQWLADTVDLIVDSAALVNALLSYSELFGPNVAGTAELIRMALTTKLKVYSYVSTADVGRQIDSSAFTEDADIRVISPTRRIDWLIDGSLANGYDKSSTSESVSQSRTLFFSIASRCPPSRASTSHLFTSTKAGNASPGAVWRNTSTSNSDPRPQWSFRTLPSTECWPWNAHFTSKRANSSCAKPSASSNLEERSRSRTCFRNRARNPT